jgi:hypothetical protein
MLPPDGDAVGFKTEPRQNIRRKIGVHDQNFVAGTPTHPVGDQMQSVRCAVGKDDVVGLAADEERQGPSQSLGYVSEAFRREFIRTLFPGDRLLGRPGGARRERTLMRTIQPDVAVKRSEIRGIGQGH